MTNPVAEDDTCDDCPKGYYTSILGQPDCTICEVGKYNNIEGSIHVRCVDCPINTYGTVAGLTDVRRKRGRRRKEEGGGGEGERTTLDRCCF